MANPRKMHVGKTKGEKQAYLDRLNTPTPPDPTYEERGSLPTDTVEDIDSDNSSASPLPLQPYNKDSFGGWRNLIITVIGGIAVAVFIIFVINLNREVGVLEHKTASAKDDRQVIREDIKTLDGKVDDIRIDVEVLKTTADNKRSD